MEKGSDLFVTCQLPLPDCKGPSPLWLSLLPGNGLERIDLELGLPDLMFSCQPRNLCRSNSSLSSVTHVTSGGSQAHVSLWKVGMVSNYTALTCSLEPYETSGETQPDPGWCHVSL